METAWARQAVRAEWRRLGLANPYRRRRVVARLVATAVALTAIFWIGFFYGKGILNVPMAKPEIAPSWIADYASAFCRGDAHFVFQHTDAAAFNLASEDDVRRVYERQRDAGHVCEGARYLGSLVANDGARQYVYALATRGPESAGEFWYVFTVAGDRVIRIE